MAQLRQPKKKSFLRRLVSKYRLVLIDETNFEERLSFRLSRINVILLALILFTLHGALVVSLVVFTPLKRHIPGYSDQQTKLNSYKASLQADSLEEKLRVRDAYITNVMAVLSGQAPADSATLFAPIAHTPTANDLAPSRVDSLERMRQQREEKYNVRVEGGPTRTDELSGIFFFAPLQGVVIQPFGSKEGHFGIDIVTKADEAVKACLDGTVVLASWTSDGGYVMQVQHPGDLVSVYKHNAVLLKKQGDKVRAGEAVAIVGNSGELTTGPHLHFELWHKGKPVDPELHMVFK